MRRAAQAPATRRGGGAVTDAPTDSGRSQSWLKNARSPQALANHRCCLGGGATLGHVDAQINFIVSFLVVQWTESRSEAVIRGSNSFSCNSRQNQNPKPNKNKMSVRFLQSAIALIGSELLFNILSVLINCSSLSAGNTKIEKKGPCRIFFRINWSDVEIRY